MIDPRRVSHPAPPGLPHANALPNTPHVVVVGGGIAGLAAATGLAERGVSVEILERQDYLGGRVGGWTDTAGLTEPRSPTTAGSTPSSASTTTCGRCCAAATPAWTGCARSRTIRWSTGRAARTPSAVCPRPRRGTRWCSRCAARPSGSGIWCGSTLLRPRRWPRCRCPRSTNSSTTSTRDTFLTNINFPIAARHLAFEVFARSFFARPERLSAAELAAMFHIYFLGSSEGLVFDVAESNFNTALWDPLRDYLIERGVRIRTGVSAESISVGGAKVLQVACHRRHRRSTPTAWSWPPTRRDCRRSSRPHPALATTPGAPRSRACAPRRRSWCSGCGWTVRSTPAGRRSSAPAASSPSTTSAWSATTNAKLRNGLARTMVRWSRCTPTRWSTRRRSRDCGSGCWAACISSTRRPRRRTSWGRPAAARRLPAVLARRLRRPAHGRHPGAGLMLAGDGIRIDLPVALMERAATTGWTAANRLLAGWGVSGHTLHTVPVQGRSPVLRRLATRERARA